MSRCCSRATVTSPTPASSATRSWAGLPRSIETAALKKAICARSGRASPAEAVGPCLRGADNRCQEYEDHGIQLRRRLCRIHGPSRAEPFQGREFCCLKISIPALAALGRAPGLLHKRPGADQGLGRRCGPDLRRRSHRRSSCSSGRAARGREDHNSGKIA